MIRMYAMYRALKVFFYIGTFLTFLGILPIIRFLIFFLKGDGSGHIQSLVLGGAFVSMGFIAFLVGLVADLISNNRQLVEMTLERAKRAELDRLKEKATTKDG
jgi:multisubunit Na+/H+ antiporter MnhG subunit